MVSTPSGVHHSILSPTGGLLSPSMMFPLYVPPGAPRERVNAASLALGGGECGGTRGCLLAVGGEALCVPLGLQESVCTVPIYPWGGGGGWTFC